MGWNDFRPPVPDITTQARVFRQRQTAANAKFCQTPYMECAKRKAAE